MSDSPRGMQKSEHDCIRNCKDLLWSHLAYIKMQAHIQAQYIKAIGSAFFMNACDA